VGHASSARFIRLDWHPDNNKATSEGYFTYRLVRGERIGGKVRQITVLNLGRHFPINLKFRPAADEFPL
jgi:hypothetical protein